MSAPGTLRMAVAGCLMRRFTAFSRLWGLMNKPLPCFALAVPFLLLFFSGQHMPGEIGMYAVLFGVSYLLLFTFLLFSLIFVTWFAFRAGTLGMGEGSNFLGGSSSRHRGRLVRSVMEVAGDIRVDELSRLVGVRELLAADALLNHYETMRDEWVPTPVRAAFWRFGVNVAQASGRNSPVHPEALPFAVNEEVPPSLAWAVRTLRLETCP